jgi:hypothetical protein
MVVEVEKALWTIGVGISRLGDGLGPKARRQYCGHCGNGCAYLEELAAGFHDDVDLGGMVAAHAMPRAFKSARELST